MTPAASKSKSVARKAPAAKAAHSRVPKIDARVAKADEFLLPTYKRAPFMLTHGRGCYVFDADGKKYLDFLGGIAVNALGHGHPRIVETILSLGRNLGVEVIAEGVETQAQADSLQRLGCAFVQGYLYSASIDGKAASAMLNLEDATLPRLQLIKN